jgi:hypothetical protein
MRALFISSLTAADLALAATAHAQPAAREAAPRYLAAIDAELTALAIPHECEAHGATRATCAFNQRGRTTQRELTVTLVYSDETDTVYLYVGSLVTAEPDAESTPAVLRRLMELNWVMLVGKLEWNETDGEVRLSMVMHTDSNFDRRAFRSLVRQIVPLADRHVTELQALAAAE